MNYIQKLKKHGKKSITKEELEALFSTSSDQELFGIISQLSEESILSPIKNSRTNGNRIYPIYLKYRVSVPADTYEAELKEISALHPLLLNNGYLQSHPNEYEKYRYQIQKLDRYLFSRKEDVIPISRKERSFEIFDKEKALDDKAFSAFLERIGITSALISFYDTPEYCFNDYIPERKSKMTLLICENKDIWFNVRRMMFENNAKVIFGVSIDGVIYGCGNKVSGVGALTAYTRFIGSDVEYLYWGDIDRAGLNIFLSTIRSNPDISISLFVPAYNQMLRLSRSRSIPDSDDERNRIEDYSQIYDLVGQELRDEIVNSIQNNKRIPQEIINYEFLKKNMR